VKTINLLCAGNKVFVKYQAQGRGVNPQPLPPLRTPLATDLFACMCKYKKQIPPMTKLVWKAQIGLHPNISGKFQQPPIVNSHARPMELDPYGNPTGWELGQWI